MESTMAMCKIKEILEHLCAIDWVDSIRTRLSPLLFCTYTTRKEGQAVRRERGSLDVDVFPPIPNASSTWRDRVVTDEGFFLVSYLGVFSALLSWLI